jgi:hypothetical protein
MGLVYIESRTLPGGALRHCGHDVERMDAIPAIRFLHVVQISLNLPALSL